MGSLSNFILKIKTFLFNLLFSDETLTTKIHMKGIPHLKLKTFILYCS